MGRKPDLTVAVRANVKLLKEEGYSNEAIARRLKIAKGSVFNTLKRLRETGSLKSLHRTGRPSKTSVKTDRRIRRMVVRNPFLTSTQVAQTLSEEGINLSVTQIKGRLKSFGLSARRPAKKPLLTEKMRRQRIDFASQYETWDDEWSKVLFSDESCFELHYQSKGTVRRPVNTRFDPRYTLKTVKHPQKLMIWGCFSSAGRGALYFLPQGKMMNSAVYLDLLKEKLLSHMNILDCEYFLHDSAPCHKAKSVNLWLSEHNVNVIKWPGNSPDLNPIENLWRHLKIRVSEDNPKSIPELKESIRRHWCLSITPEYCQSLSTSMKRRLLCVKANRGNTTKY